MTDGPHWRYFILGSLVPKDCEVRWQMFRNSGSYFNPLPRESFFACFVLVNLDIVWMTPPWHAHVQSQQG
jgi:hypothetical protein